MSLTIQNKDQQETLLLPHPKNSFTQNLEFRRWLILISFSFFASTTAMAWITYAPIVDEAQKYYSVTTDAIIEFSNASMYTYFLMSFIVAWMSYKWFNCSLIFCMMANASGAWIRYFAGTSYTIALIGQYIAGTAQNIVLFAPVLIADRWFAAHERDWAVSIATFSGVFGWGFGFMFPAFLVQNGGSGEIAKLLKYEALIASIPLILGIFTLKDKPKMPPSYSASIKETTENNFWKEFCLLVKDKKFLGAAVCFGSLTGLSYTISSVIVLFMPTLSILQQGFIGTTFLSCGIIGGLVGTFLLSRSKKLNYDYALKVFVVMSLVGLVVLALVIKSTKELVNIYILNGILGVGILGFQPFACQILVEMTFPLQETISVNFMMVIAQVFGVVGNFLSSSPLVGDKGLWALVGLTTPCIFYIVFFYKTDAKRTNAEEKHASFVGESLGGESTVYEKCFIRYSDQDQDLLNQDLLSPNKYSKKIKYSQEYNKSSFYFGLKSIHEWILIAQALGLLKKERLPEDTEQKNNE